MTQTEIHNNTLNKNSVTNFILRIDLVNTENDSISNIASEMRKFFYNAEKQFIAKVDFHFNEKNTKITDEVRQSEYILSTEDKLVKMTFSENENAIILQTNRYRDNTAYKEHIKNAIEIIRNENTNIQAKRIGLRYINDFNCDSFKKISSIFGKRLSAVVKKMIHDENQSRIICIEEFNNNSYKLRLQYGIPNKFYPSAITIPNLLLDIDSYAEITSCIDDWTDIIRKLNHTAYENFILEMNPKYIASVRWRKTFIKSHLKNKKQ